MSAKTRVTNEKNESHWFDMVDDMAVYGSMMLHHIWRFPKMGLPLVILVIIHSKIIGFPLKLSQISHLSLGCPWLSPWRCPPGTQQLPLAFLWVAAPATWEGLIILVGFGSWKSWLNKQFAIENHHLYKNNRLMTKICRLIMVTLWLFNIAVENHHL